VLELGIDPVANVRFTVARTLEVIVKESGGGIDIGSKGSGMGREIFSVLNKLLTDSDKDVRFFAEKVSVLLLYIFLFLMFTNYTLCIWVKFD